MIRRGIPVIRNTLVRTNNIEEKTAKRPVQQEAQSQQPVQAQSQQPVQSQAQAQSQTQHPAQKLKILSSGKTEKLNFQFYENLFRYGVLGDGACYFHALLAAIKSEYISMSDVEKQSVTRKFRQELANDLTRDIFSRLFVGEYSLYEFIKNPKNDDRPKYELSIVCSDPEKPTVEEALLAYRMVISKFSRWMSDDIQQFISDVLDVDIYLFSDKTRGPYPLDNNPIRVYKNRPSVVLINVGGSHYELVGLSTDDLGDSEKVKIFFSHDHHFIQKCFVHSLAVWNKLHPNDIDNRYQNYPEFLEYYNTVYSSSY